MRRLLAEHLGRRPRVDVLPTLERLAQHRLAGDVGEDAELDLAVVGREEPVPVLGDERRPDLAAEIGPDRDRLQVRVRRREPPRGGDGLVERRVQPAVTLRDQRRQRQQVGVEQLRVLAPLLDHRHDLVVRRGSRAGHGCRSSSPSCPCGPARAQLLEQDSSHLLGRAEHELLAGEVGGERLELLDPIREPGGDLAHAVRVDLDACVLHRREHRGQRQLDVLVELERAALDDALAHRRGEPAGCLGMPDEARRRLLRGRLRVELEAVLGREVVDEVRRAAGLDQVRREHRVVGRSEREVQRLRVVRDELGVAKQRRL